MRILIYHIGSLGDGLVSIPSLRALRAHFGSGAELHVLHDVQANIPVTSKSVFDGIGLVDGFIPYRFERSLFSKLVVAVALWRNIRRLRFQAVVSLLPSERGRWALLRDRIFFRLCGIRKCVGFHHLSKAVIHPRITGGKPAIIRREAVFRAERIERDGIAINDHCFSTPLFRAEPSVERDTLEWLERQRKHPELPLIGIGPGCKQGANSWPLERFMELGVRLLNTYRVELIVVGGPSERPLAERMVSEWGSGIVAAGKLSIAESSVVLSQCDLLVGLDTGTTHLAAAVNTPCVVIQGARNQPGQWDPLGHIHRVVRNQVDCAVCLRQNCPKAGHPCMTGISVDQVWQAIADRLARLNPETPWMPGRSGLTPALYQIQGQTT